MSAFLPTVLALAPVRAQAPDASAAPPSAPPKQEVTEVLHNTRALSRIRMRCRPAGEEEKGQKPLDRLHCAFASTTLRQQPPEPMATLENYGEILRELRARCRANSPRSEPARLACAACRKELSDACLYRQAMLDLRKGCAKLGPAATHANPAVAALERAEAERGEGRSQVMRRFCAACVGDDSARCFSAFWGSVHPPARCVLASDAFALELTRQGQSSSWLGNLGGPCNTQIALALDERRKVWTYTELRLSPERCAQGEALSQSREPATYSSAPQYAFSELALGCERLSLF